MICPTPQLGTKESFLLPNTDRSHGDKREFGLGPQSALLPAEATFPTQRSNTARGAEGGAEAWVAAERLGMAAFQATGYSTHRAWSSLWP